MFIEFKTQFVYLLAFAVGFNFLFDKLKAFSCTTDHFLESHVWARHFMYFVPMFFVIVLFTNNNSNLAQLPDFQRYYKLLSVTAIMYLIFLLLIRCEVQVVLLIGALMVILYCIYSEITYTKLKLTNKDKNNESLDQIETEKVQKTVDSLEKAFIFVLGLCGILVCFGVISYLGRQSMDHGGNWSWAKFWFGTERCGSRRYTRPGSLVVNFGHGLARLVGYKK